MIFLVNDECTRRKVTITKKITHKKGMETVSSITSHLFTTPVIKDTLSFYSGKVISIVYNVILVGISTEGLTL